MSAKWKGVDKPGGTIIPTVHTIGSEPDCPGCKYGTLKDKDVDHMECRDCKRTYTLTLLRKLGVMPTRRYETGSITMGKSHIVGGQARESDERCPAPTGSTLGGNE